MEISGANSERIIALSRTVAVVVGTFATWLWTKQAGPTDSVVRLSLSIGMVLYTLGSLALLIATYYRPQPVHFRSLCSILLDISAVSAGLYLAAGFLDATAVFYVWIMLGSGLMYGTFYLVFSAVVSVILFGLVWALSPYWRDQPHFSLLIVALMIVVGPYLTILTNRLHATRREMLWQANHDALTGLLNRRAFGEVLEEQFTGRSENVEHMLLCLDLDRFKAVNDTAGHAAGDELLKNITSLFEQNIDRPHTIGRLGGDEFAVLLSNASAEVGRQCAERLRSEVASYRLAWGTDIFEVGVSIGVAPASAVTDIDGWLRLADAACYAAKNNGRNQVHVVANIDGLADTQVIRKLVLDAQAAPRTDDIAQRRRQ